MAYLILLGGVFLAGMLAVFCGLVAGWICDSTLIASLASIVLYAGLLLAGCWLLYKSTPSDPLVHDQAARFVVVFGGFFFIVGGSLCAAVPIVFRSLTRD